MTWSHHKGRYNSGAVALVNISVISAGTERNGHSSGVGRNRGFARHGWFDGKTWTLQGRFEKYPFEITKAIEDPLLGKGFEHVAKIRRVLQRGALSIIQFRGPSWQYHLWDKKHIANPYPYPTFLLNVLDYGFLFLFLFIHVDLHPESKLHIDGIQ